MKFDPERLDLNSECKNAIRYKEYGLKMQLRERQYEHRTQNIVLNTIAKVYELTARTFFQFQY